MTAARRAVDIARVTAAFFGFSITDIRSASRKAPLVRARKACALALRRSGFPYEGIGEALRRDHSAVMEMIKHERLGALVIADEDPEFEQAVAAGARA